MFPQRISLKPAHWYVLDEVDVAAAVTRHAALRSLCAITERMADALPARSCPTVLAATAHRLRSFADAPDTMDALLVRLVSGRAEPAATIARRLSREWHTLDAAHAHDLADVLIAWAGGQGTPAVDVLAYMLRCFFEGCRRTITFREMAVVTFGAHRLTPAAAESLRTSLARA